MSCPTSYLQPLLLFLPAPLSASSCVSPGRVDIGIITMGLGCLPILHLSRVVITPLLVCKHLRSSCCTRYLLSFFFCSVHMGFESEALVFLFFLFSVGLPLLSWLCSDMGLYAMVFDTYRLSRGVNKKEDL